MGFGDFELKETHTLVVTAMSEHRMAILLGLLNDLAGNSLGDPQIERDQVKRIAKR